MKNKFLAMLLIAPSLAFAHIQNGLWQGTAADGKTCEMLVIENLYENSTHHPLNERIKVQIQNEEFLLRHPSVISVEEKSAFFNHDLFESIAPHSKGAKALVVKMEHAAGKEGPTEFHLINHQYKTDQRELQSCTGLKFIR